MTGAATLSDATVNATVANGAYVDKRHAIVTAGRVSGTFGSTVNTNLPSGFKSALSYKGRVSGRSITANKLEELKKLWG